MERKKTSLLILGVCAFILSVIGVTYAFWQLRLQQTEENNLTTSCFDVELIDEKDAIKLEKAYPILDEEGEELTPYTFTLRNNCNANVKYQINLESLNKVGGDSIEDQRLESQYIKEKLNETDKDGSINILTDNPSVETTLDEAVESYKLTTGYMTTDEKTKNFELRLWLRGDLTMEDEEAMNKTFASKITIVATYAKEAKKTLVDTILALKPEAEDSGSSGIYRVTHEDASITYTQDPYYQTRLKQDEYRYAGSNPNNYVDFGEKVTEDQFELIACFEGEMCTNAQYFGLPIESVSSTQEQCNIEKSKLENALGGNLEGISLSCTQTASAGDSLYWRIIGLVNTPEGQRVKLIRETSIGTYSWDTSEENLNEGYGVNEWSQSDLMKLLNPGYKENQDQSCTMNEEFDVICNNNLVNNSLYWNGEKGKCYINVSNIATDCDFINTKMLDSLKNMIDTVTWNTGSQDGSYTAEYETDSYSYISYDTMNVNEFYEIERSNNTGKMCDGGDYCNDEVERTTIWKGKVGLMYSSDYGYATSGGENDNRITCLNTPVALWYDILHEEDPVHHPGCYENDWLLSKSGIEWTLSPLADSTDAEGVYSIYDSGLVMGGMAAVNAIIRPSVYLKSDVFVQQGDGSQERPYVLEME